MSDLVKTKEILSSFVMLYRELLSITEKERASLVDADTESLSKIVELKQYISLKTKKLEDELKTILEKYGAESVDEFLFVASESENVDETRVLNGMLHEILTKFNKELEINRMIMQESVSFYNSMLNMYMSFVTNKNNSYDKNAAIDISQHSSGMRV